VRCFIFTILLYSLQLALSSLGFASPVKAQPPRSFVDVGACMRGSFKRATCIEAFDDAWEVYRDRAAKFKTRDQCNAQFKVCVVFNPPSAAGRPVKRLTPANLNYAPPFLGVVLASDGVAVQVLIDTTRKTLGVGVPSRRNESQKSNTKKRGFAGDNFAPLTGAFTSSQPTAPEMSSGEQQSSSPQIDAPSATSLDGVSSYPVPANRRRNKK
jgi:uncharacterized protein YgiB involved in biofilm formation